MSFTSSEILNSLSETSLKIFFEESNHGIRHLFDFIKKDDHNPTTCGYFGTLLLTLVLKNEQDV